MEPSLSSLSFQGSISVAILEAKNQRKLFLVYVSGEDAESAHLEKSTWTDSRVADSVSKYCILLHIMEGSTEATQFSAIYPQKSVPCMTAVGYNGIQLWQSEGFVTAEVLSSSLEKAWLGLHIQETTATVLTAALSSKKSEPSTSGTSSTSSSGPSSTVLSPSSLVPSLVASMNNSEIVKEDSGCVCLVEDKNTVEIEKTSSNHFDVKESESVSDELSTSSSEAAIDNAGAKDGSLASKVIINPHSGSDSQVITTEAVVQDEKAESLDDKKNDVLDKSMKMNTSSEVLLNIRLPDGSSLQEKFSVTDTLLMVKDFVDKNEASCIGSYDLAIPYPRKVFSDQELRKSLSELDLFYRQALIVVPYQRAAGYNRGRSSSSIQTTITTNVHSPDGGYFAFVKRVLGYVNPLSYIGGGGATSSNSSQESQDGTWEYGPNPTVQSRLGGSDGPTSSTGRNDRKSRQPTTSSYGSNIHTLKHDDDDDRFNDKNAFWNGNSTQYGGGNDGK